MKNLMILNIMYVTKISIIHPDHLSENIINKTAVISPYIAKLYTITFSLHLSDLNFRENIGNSNTSKPERIIEISGKNQTVCSIGSKKALKLEK